jgi:hypothetical protein
VHSPGLPGFPFLEVPFLPDQPQTHILWRLLLWLFEAVVAFILLIDAIARPIYRPLLDWIATWEFMHRMAARIAPLPRFAILVLFAVPFAIAEPLKVLALYLIARGLAVTGIVLLVFAYLMSFLIVERIYDAGRGKLLTYWWFAWAMTQIVRVRDILMALRRRIVARVRTWLPRRM